MRIALVSDIHGNCLALEAVLADLEAQHVDATVNLGDIVSGPLEPRRAAGLLLGLDWPTISGNHDRLVIADVPTDPLDRFARNDLAPAHLEWMARLPATRTFNGEIFMCHGTPWSDEVPWLDGWFRGREMTLPDEPSVTTPAEGFDFPVLLCGHTHVARAVRLRDGRLIVNPGSVGLQMYYGLPDARYALLDRRAGQWSVTFRTVPYDFDAAGRQATANGFPSWRDALLSGWAPADALF